MKKIAAFVLSLASVFSFVACGGNGGKGDGQVDDIKIANDYKGSLSISYLPGDQAEYVILNSVVTEFKKEYPNIKVSMRALSGSDYLQAVAQMAPAGNIGDVIFCTDENLQMMAKRNYFENLSPYLEQEKIAFDDTLYNSQVMDMAKIDGSYYMMPRENTQVVISVNKTMFEEVQAVLNADEDPTNDITMPDNEWTLDDAYEICGKIQPYLNEHKPNSLQRYAISFTHTWAPIFNAVIKANGGKLVEDNKLLIDETTQTAFDELKRFYDAGYAPISNSVMFTTQEVMFAVTTATHHTKNANMKKSNGDAVEIDYLPFPKTGEEGAAYIPAGTSGYGMFSRSSHKREAFAFLMFMMSDKGQTALCESGNIIPVMNKYCSEETLKTAWAKTQMVNGTEVSLNNEAFVYNYDKVQLNDMLNSLERYDKNVEIKNAFIEMIRSYTANEASWSSASGKVYDKVGGYFSK